MILLRNLLCSYLFTHNFDLSKMQQMVEGKSTCEKYIEEHISLFLTWQDLV